MESIRIKRIEKRGNLIEIRFSVSGNLRQYFISDTFSVEYSEDVSGTPDSMAILPFVCNVLPIVWLTGAKFEVDEIDADFMAGCPDILKGYKEMYPMFKFNGTINANRIVKNEVKQSSPIKTAAFFSGGVDAFATLIAHIYNHPTLLTLMGSDIALDDVEGWNIVKNHVVKTCQDFDLDHVFIRSNFRVFINNKTLDKLVANSGDGWWHGFQHGIGLIGHAAPIVWKSGLSIVYIAASFTIKSKGKVTCASDPSIDDNVKMAGCVTIHDQYEYERIQKVEHIVDFVKRTHTPLELRVCWITRGGRNCCKCEKCLRTMFEIFAFGEDPHGYGFDYSEKDLKKSKHIVLSNYNFISKPLWEEIQKEFINNPALSVPHEIDWIRTIDFEKERLTSSFRFYAAWCLILNLPNRIIRKINYLIHSKS